MSRTRRAFRLLRRTAFFIAVCISTAAAFAQSPPPQPTSGPGGSQAQYTVQQNSYGSGATQFWIYTPQPLPAPAPVVVFMHGFGATTPGPYQAWIDHIVKRGNIVIYPRYQENATDPVRNYTPNAITAIKNALGIIGPSADLSRFAFLGHSLGGVLEFNIAARATAEGLPVAKAMFAAHPGDALLFGDLEIYPQIPSSTLVLILVGDADDLVGDASARSMMAALPHVPGKTFLTVQSDNRGNPPLVASHIAPNAPPVDALDYFAYWKLSDALMDFAFYGIEGDIALGGGQNQVAMGSWSDGVPVKPLGVRPTISIPGILNAASLLGGPIAPGQMVVINGAGLGLREIRRMEVDGQGRIARALSDTRVLFQGIASPLVYTFMNQVAAIVPFAVGGLSSVTVMVESGTYTSGPVTVPVAPAAPGIFSVNGTGSGQGAILNQNFTANSSRNPAPKGSRIIIFGTGEGLPSLGATEGALTASVAAQPLLPVAVTIGGVPAPVLFSGTAPGFFAGVLQVIAELPASLPSGDLPVILRVGNVSGQTGITVAVK